MSASSQVGLSIDDSSHNNSSSADAAVVAASANVLLPSGSNSLKNHSSQQQHLATKAARADLQRRVETLQKQLVTAREALLRIQNPPTITAPGASGSGWEDLDVEDDSDLAQEALPPPSKRGYLFKWNDRSMGWTGTKWALRFVELSQGRISYYGSHTDNRPRYELCLRGCAVRDDGWKRNQRHPSFKKKGDPPPGLTEAGAYFFLFSIYFRPDYSHVDSDSEIIPLLRFSTNSLAEKGQWIKLISETCAYCETEAFQADETARAAEALRQQQQQLDMAMAMPEAKEGTLPPLYFAPAKRKDQKKLQRKPSFTRTPSSKLFRTKSQNIESDQDDAKNTKGYPPSKPMHRSAAPSYLSVDAPVQNYRGFFNLGIIILIVSNFRLMLDTIRRHGFVLMRVAEYIRNFRSISKDPWEDFPFVSGFSLLLIFVLVALGIEKLLSQKRVNETVGMVLHHVNAHLTLATSMFIAWHFIHKPTVGAALLIHGTITWMKILSYALANEDYRNRRDVDAHKATLALIENLDGDDEDIMYPRNVTLPNIFYFWCAPTLTYQIAFPKSPHVRWWKVAGYILRMVIVFGLFTFVLAQVVSPALEGLVTELELSHGTYTAGMLAEYWLRLSVANTYLWLLMFYFYFHLYLNFVAEILRFGDRVFYKDWWNSSEVGAYWRLWNLPVHYWLIRHMYFPCIRLKMSRSSGTFVVFLFSAVMHEVLVSIPFHMVRPWSFIGMMMQMPLVALTKYHQRKYPGSSLGNVLFWLTFSVIGQPMAILLYTVDFQYGEHKHSGLEIFEEDEQCRVMWRQHCLIR